MPFADFRCDILIPLQAPAVTRLNDCGADVGDLELRIAVHRQLDTWDVPLPWLQAIELGMISPLHFRQRIAAPLGRDYVGRIVQPTEMIRSFSKESDMPRSSVRVNLPGSEAQFAIYRGTR